ncbi:MAG: NAD(P)-dependent alcohol dehydrogenase [Armatimonadetes bacterium 55-13]|nr:NAD(P)-dependent alcohol dehydrogenase [Armatimonadota bacterium]OJU61896.1 MAG: NAD(P)-dependent alcohol dehydrogenase [Armatimonadetes bacterium 55-13]
MKSYVLKEAPGFESLDLVEKELGPIGPHEVRVRVRAISLNYRDLMVAKGAYGTKGFQPVVPASDGAGEVVEVGSAVTRWKAGDKVAGIFMQTWLAGPPAASYAASALGGAIDGMMAEEVVLHEDGLVAIPAGYSFEEAATLPCAAVTAWNAFYGSGALKAGDTVLLQGTGGVSLFALQLAKAAGARVMITSSSDEKLVRAKELGADETINYRTKENWEVEAFRLTDSRGVDQVVEVGGGGTLNRSLKAVRYGGTVSVIGVLSGTSGEVATPLILGKAIRVQGIYVGSRTMFEDMNRAIEANGIRPVIDRVFEFSEAKAAYEYMESAQHFGKIVIRV